MRSRFNRRLDMEARFAKAKRKNMVYAEPGLHKCILVLDGLKPDFNIGKIFRTADAFGAREIHMINVDFFDPEPAKGSLKWVMFHQHPDFTACYEELSAREYTFFCLEPGSPRQLGSEPFPEKTAFVLGHEEFGLSFSPADYQDMLSITIPQWGHVQSLNVSIAASVALYEYTRQHGKPLDQGFEQMPAGQYKRELKGGR